jgi:serine/threonine protein kinase
LEGCSYVKDLVPKKIELWRNDRTCRLYAKKYGTAAVCEAEMFNYDRIAHVKGLNRVVELARGYVVVEYDGGYEDLFEHMQRWGGLREADVKRRAYLILEPLLAIHAAGYAHGDLKLENVLVSDDVWDIKLIDFQTVRSLWDCSPPRIFTPAYMAPEWWRAGVYSPAPAESWAFGVMIFVMLTGSMLYKSPKDARYHINFVPLKNVSGAANDLLSKLLTASGRGRMLLQDAVNHEWFNDIEWPARPVEK